MKKNENGFSLVEILIVLAVIGLIGGAGWYVMRSRDQNNAHISTQEEDTKEKVPTKELSLTNKAVTFEIPETWVKGGIGCVEGAPIFGNEKVLDSTEVLASSKQESSADPYFSVNVCVFDNPQKMKPQEWANSTDGGASIGYPSENDKTSEEPINGNSAFYMKFTSEEHGGNEDVYYVISSGDKIVYVSSRLRYDMSTPVDEGQGADGKVFDFRKYEPAIVDLASSIVIK